jgi:hypothetical protein
VLQHVVRVVRVERTGRGVAHTVRLVHAAVRAGGERSNSPHTLPSSGVSAGLGCVLGPEEVEQFPDRMSLLGFVPHLGVWIDRVVVSSPVTPPLEVVRLDEVEDDPLSRPLRDPDYLGDVSESDVAVVRDAQEHLCVVREERPRPVFLSA